MASDGERERFVALGLAFKEALAHTTDGPFGQVSGLWRTLLENRDNFPNYDQFTIGLRRDASFAVGIGVGLHKPPDAAGYQRQFETWVQRVADLFPPEDLARWPEPALGSPTVVEHAGYRASVLYIKNYSQVHLLLSLLRKHGRRTSGLNVLEIGAGYGGVAEILIRMGVASRYAIIDLPNNLFLSMQYLGLNFPDRTAAINNRAADAGFKQADLRFALPNDISSLDEGFDLVINTASLGEMPAATAQAYVAWVSRHLSDDGVFISHNTAHERNAAEVVQRHSDYGYQRFHFEGVYPNQPTGGPLHTQHLAIVLSKARIPRSEFDWIDLDRLGCLLNLGLNHEMQKVCGFVNDPAQPLAKEFFERIDRFLRAVTLPEKYAAAAGRTGDGNYDLILEFLQGATAFLQGDLAGYGHLLKYLAAAQSPMAIALALLTVRMWGGRTLDVAEERILLDAWVKVPSYVREQLNALRTTAAQARFSTYLPAALIARDQ